jgi:AcrR family transcriptional regulator
VARATVYHQFGSKLGLLEAVVRDFEERAGLDALVRLVETAPADRLIRAVVTAGCDYWATDPPLTRTVIAFAVTDADAARQLAGHDAGRLRLLSRLVDRLIAEGRPPACSPAQAVDTLWLLTSFGAYDELARGRGLATAAVAELLADLAERRLAAP